MKPLQTVRRIIVAVIGGTVLLIGLALIFLPGPAFIVIPLGLAILATEFVWARNWLKRAKEMFNDSRKKTPTRKDAGDTRTDSSG